VTEQRRTSLRPGHDVSPPREQHILFADTPSRALEFDATIKSLKYGHQLLDSMSPRTLSRRGCWLRSKALVFAAVWGQLLTLVTFGNVGDKKKFKKTYFF